MTVDNVSLNPPLIAQCSDLQESISALSILGFPPSPAHPVGSRPTPSFFLTQNGARQIEGLSEYSSPGRSSSRRCITFVSPRTFKGSVLTFLSGLQISPLSPIE